ncbi:MAG: sel1 repeat family protein [Candidatus Methanomethylophilaceae archaeon]|nr:sel1 repeat family protein [Candidatus Methanomethylophilaceae archaeon]
MTCFKDSANIVKDSRAQLQLGLMYLRGEGTDHPDNSKAFMWVKKAASNSNLEATFLLGQMYKAGCGCTIDLDLAFINLESAALKGHRGAQILLGNMYLKGEGVRANKSTAEHWFRVADGKEPISRM